MSETLSFPLKNAETVSLFVVDEFPTAKAEQQAGSTYLCDFKVYKTITLTKEQEDLLKMAAADQTNYLKDMVKSCPFKATYAVSFTRKKETTTLVISGAPCSKVQIFNKKGKKPKNNDLKEGNSLESAIASIINK